MLIDYALLTGSSYLIYKAVEKLDPAELLVNKLRKKSKHCLTLGYKRRLGMKCDIVVDMAKTPHCLISGISGSGKSMMALYALKEKKNVYLLNAFPSDFQGLNCKRIFKPNEMLKFLTGLVEKPKYYEEGMWICIDEGLVLCTSDKKYSKAIMDLLAVCRHYNIWVVEDDFDYLEDDEIIEEIVEDEVLDAAQEAAEEVAETVEEAIEEVTE